MIDNQQTITGDFSYQTKNFDASLSHSLVHNELSDFAESETQTSLTANVALAFADGSLGITSKIRDSFVIVKNHDMWKGVELGINPSFGDFEHKTKGGLLKPVLTNMRSYREGDAIIQSLQDDRLLETNDYFFMHGHKQGSRITIGDAAIYLVRATLIDELKLPVSYKGLRLEKEGSNPVNTFTNSAGRFVATGLSPGVWTLKIQGREDTVPITVEGEDTMVFLGKIFLE